MQNKSNKKNIWSYVIFGVLLVVVLLPDTRIFLQQQLMKIGLFRPKLDQPQRADSTAEDITPVTFVDKTGNVISISDLKGKVVFINFWATWCPPCKAEMPSIQSLYNKFKENDKVRFLLVEIDSNVDGATTFLEEEKLTLPIVFPQSDIPATWLSDAIPTTVILNKEGALAVREQGMRDYSAKSVEEYIQNLINE